MIRQEFIDVVTNLGMATLKELKRLSLTKDDEISEFELLGIMSGFWGSRPNFYCTAGISASSTGCWEVWRRYLT
jgi:hypothetical protein